MIDLQNAFVLEKDTARAMQTWLAERCQSHEAAVTPFSRLHADWIAWANRHKLYRSTPRRLAMALGFLGFKRCVIHSGNTRSYKGIALKAGETA